MGENATKIGKKLESFGGNFFPQLSWDELCRDREIKCSRTSHKKRTHGIDLLFKFENPYNAKKQGIIVECKNRQMKSITQDEIEKWVKELINNIECAQSSPDLKDVDLSDATLNTGLLLVHANDSFEKEKFYSYLKKLHFPNRRNPINIFIAGNDKINLWTSILNKINLSYSAGFSFLYPSINGFSKVITPTLTINAMFSKFIFAQSKYEETRVNTEGEPYMVPHTQHIMFFLDTITPSNFKYAWSMFKYYQLQGASRYVFIFYPRGKDDVEFIKNDFIKTLKSGKNPISEEEAQKIKLDFFENRDLSVIETGGV